MERLRVSDVGTVLTPLLCLLAWAKEPVTEEGLDMLLSEHFLRSLSDWGESFRQALEHGHMMLQRRPNADGEVGWTIYHDSFRNPLLTTKAVQKNRDWAQRRWLEVCEQWQRLEREVPSLYRYALRHYAEHFHEIIVKYDDEWAKLAVAALFKLARNDEFAKTQQRVLPNEPHLPLLTIQLALDWEVAKTAAQSGLTQKAVEFARQIARGRKKGYRR